MKNTPTSPIPSVKTTTRETATLAEVVFACRYIDGLISEEVEKTAQTGNGWLYKLRRERSEWFRILDAKRKSLLAEWEPVSCGPDSEPAPPAMTPNVFTVATRPARREARQ